MSITASTIRTARRVDRFTYAIRNIVAEAKKVEQAGIRERRCVVSLPLSSALFLLTEIPEMPEEDVASFLEIGADAPNLTEADAEQLLHLDSRLSDIVHNRIRQGYRRDEPDTGPFIIGLDDHDFDG